MKRKSVFFIGKCDVTISEIGQGQKDKTMTYFTKLELLGLFGLEMEDTICKCQRLLQTTYYLLFGLI